MTDGDGSSSDAAEGREVHDIASRDRSGEVGAAAGAAVGGEVLGAVDAASSAAAASALLRRRSSANEDACCRICLMESEPEDLISPCKCQGSVQFVHKACIERWCSETGASTCELCKTTFPDALVAVGARARDSQAADAAAAGGPQTTHEAALSLFAAHLSAHFDAVAGMREELTRAPPRNAFDYVRRRLTQTREGRNILYRACVFTAILLVAAYIFSVLAGGSPATQDAATDVVRFGVLMVPAYCLLRVSLLLLARVCGHPDALTLEEERDAVLREHTTTLAAMITSAARQTLRRGSARARDRRTFPVDEEAAGAAAAEEEERGAAAAAASAAAAAAAAALFSRLEPLARSASGGSAASATRGGLPRTGSGGGAVRPPYPEVRWGGMDELLRALEGATGSGGPLQAHPLGAQPP